MLTWSEFATAAPRISAIFQRRHRAAGDLCFLGTLRPNGAPRISPMEPRVFEGRLWLIGMPGTAKFADLVRDPRLELHTATIDPHVSDGDAKLWGSAVDVPDPELHARFAQDLYSESGFDLRGQVFEHFFEALISGASSVEVVDDHLDITVWRAGAAERVIRKH